MKTIITLILVALSVNMQSQTGYEKAMSSALENWSKAETSEDLSFVINQFDSIAEKHIDKAYPLYYSILVRTLQGFKLPKSDAFKSLEVIESDYKNLTELMDNDETKVLKGLYLTLKISKNPMVFGRTLSASVLKNYKLALKDNPKNPRAILGLANFNMGSASFWGNNPKEYCPKIEEAINLFAIEASEPRTDFSPKWGLKQAEFTFNQKCKN